jgi:hypothetical protein
MSARDDRTAGQTDTARRSADQLRAAIKWLVTALGAVATVLLAGVQLSQLGNADSTLDWVVALLATVLTVMAVAYVIARLLAVIMPSTEFLSSDIAKELAAEEPELLGGYGNNLEDVRNEYRRALRARRDALEGNYASPPFVTDDEATAAQNRVLDMTNFLQPLLDLAAFKNLRKRFDDAKIPILIAAVAAVLGIVTFATVTTTDSTGAARGEGGQEDEPSGSPGVVARLTNAKLVGGELAGASLPSADFTDADLRHADFRGAELRRAKLVRVHAQGADFRDADLSGATFLRSDLTGALLVGARVVGVNWTDTRCPDGSNSDEDAGHTCVGHTSV